MPVTKCRSNLYAYSNKVEICILCGKTLFCLNVSSCAILMRCFKIFDLVACFGQLGYTEVRISNA